MAGFFTPCFGRVPLNDWNRTIDRVSHRNVEFLALRNEVSARENSRKRLEHEVQVKQAECLELEKAILTIECLRTEFRNTLMMELSMDMVDFTDIGYASKDRDWVDKINQLEQEQLEKQIQMRGLQHELIRQTLQLQVRQRDLEVLFTAEEHESQDRDTHAICVK